MDIIKYNMTWEKWEAESLKKEEGNPLFLSRLYVSYTQSLSLPPTPIR